jgi:hypothetical protein
MTASPKVLRSSAKRRWIASLPCVISGRASQCAHVGGLTEGKGMARKCSDTFTLPLAPEYHDMADGRRKLPDGKTGRKAFEAFYGIDLIARATELHWRWLRTWGK